MNREQCKALLPVMTAFIEGKAIQFCAFPGSGKWIYTEHPAWSSSYQYRVQPEKQTQWMNMYSDSRRGMSRADADACAGSQRVACIEVEYYEGQGLEDQDE